MVEDERDAEQRDAAREQPLERERELPARASRASRAASRALPRAAPRAAPPRAAPPAPPWSTVSAAVTVTTRSVSTSARLTRSGTPAASARARRGPRLGVVHLDPCRGSRGRAVGRDERLELALPGRRRRARPRRGSSAARPGSPSRSSSSTVRRDRGLARILVRAGDRQRRRLDDDRRAAAARDERLERRPESGKRSASRTAAPTPRSPRAARGGRSTTRVVGRVDDRRPASRRAGDVGIPSARDRALQPQERRPEAPARPEARSEQVRHPPVGHHRRVAVLVRPGDRVRVRATPTPVPRALAGRRGLCEVDRVGRMRRSGGRRYRRRCPTTRPSRSATKCVYVSVSSQCPATRPSPPRADRPVSGEARRRLHRLGHRALQLHGRLEIARLAVADEHPVDGSRRLSGGLTHGLHRRAAEAEPEPGVDQLVERGHVDEVAGQAGVDPGRGRGRVEVPDELRLAAACPAMKLMTWSRPDRPACPMT